MSTIKSSLSSAWRVKELPMLLHIIVPVDTINSVNLCCFGFFFPAGFVRAKGDWHVNAGTPLPADFRGMRGMGCSALVTCLRVCHVSGRGAQLASRPSGTRSGSGLAGMSTFTADTHGAIPPKRAEWMGKVAPFSTICHYLKWRVIVLCGEFPYASNRELGANFGGLHLSISLLPVAPTIFSGSRTECLCLCVVLWWKTQGSFSCSQRKLTISMRQKIKMLITFLTGEAAPGARSYWAKLCYCLIHFSKSMKWHFVEIVFSGHGEVSMNNTESQEDR